MCAGRASNQDGKNNSHTNYQQLNTGARRKKAFRQKNGTQGHKKHGMDGFRRDAISRKNGETVHNLHGEKGLGEKEDGDPPEKVLI